MISPKPSLLIVVPTLNSYKILPYLLSSLEHQSCLSWRLLFVDGASSGSHREWLKRCCMQDSRFKFVVQQESDSGIFGAMNLGFSFAQPSDWILFWGSDDLAASNTVFDEILAVINHGSLNAVFPDLIVCRGRYFKSDTGLLGRFTAFRSSGLISTDAFRRSLFLGSTPPHQATLFGPGARRLLDKYSPDFRLSADLDYFLKLSLCPGLLVQCLDLDLVHMSDAGVSGQQTCRRLQEVRQAYRNAFGRYWWFPFLTRYIRRLLSLLQLF